MCVYMFTDEVILSIKNHLKKLPHLRRPPKTARGELQRTIVHIDDVTGGHNLWSLN